MSVPAPSPDSVAGSALFRLDGRTALVVGAGRGIGRAIARTFAAAGASVVCADQDGATAAATAAAIAEAGGQAMPRTSDARRMADAEADVAAAVGRFGGLHVLVYGAAMLDPPATVPDLPEERWLAVMDVNLNGAFRYAAAAVPAIRAAGGGSVILIASQLGSVATPGRAVYCAGKGALIQLAKTMALDHAGDGIRVNALSPGPIATERLSWRHGTMAAAREAMNHLVPLGRLGEAPEIAAAALFLASDAASFMTGADLLVDGGHNAR